MAEAKSRLETVLQRAAPSSRRDFLKRSVVMATALPAVGTLLAACGDDDDDDDGGNGDTDGGDSGEQTATSRQSIPGPATEADEAESDATEADADATEPAGDATEESEPTEAESGEATEPAGSSDAPQGGTLIIMGHEGVPGLSPQYIGPTVNWSMITQIHNALAEMDPWYEYQPVLAESWETNEDGSQYTFTLRQGVMFHDGEEFTSEDAAYTFEFYGNIDNATLIGSDFTTVDSIETPDDYTVVVNLTGPNAAFISQAGSTFIVPAHYHGEIGEDAYAQAPIGTGAFQLAEYQPDSHVLAEAFDDHFRGRPNLDAVRLNVVPEPSVRAIALETGDADSSVWSLNTEDNIRLRDSGDFQVLVGQSTAVNHMPMSFLADQFQEREVRQALMYAIDRHAIVDELWQGLAVRAETNFSPALAYWFDDSNVQKYDYDPEMAMQILDEAGWVPGDDGIRAKDGVRLSWVCGIIAGDQARRPIAESVQQWVSEIGCEFEIRETTAIIENLSDNTVQMGLYNWTYGGDGGDPDATGVLHSDFSNQYFNYSNPEMDELLEAGLAEPDPEARREIYVQVQQLWCEDVPALYIQFWDWFTFYSMRVGGVPEDVLSPTESYNMAYQFWIDEGA